MKNAVRKTLLIVTSLVLMSSCRMMLPELYEAVDDIATDGVVEIRIDKEAFQYDQDIILTLGIINHEGKPEHKFKK